MYLDVKKLELTRFIWGFFGEQVSIHLCAWACVAAFV